MTDLTPEPEGMEIDHSKPDDIVNHNGIPSQDVQSNSDLLATNWTAMVSTHMATLNDLDTHAETVSVWQIEDYNALQHKQRGPRFDCGENQWQILLYPYGNNVDQASIYLEHVDEATQDRGDNPRDWAACVQFMIVLSNTSDPSIFVQHSAHHRFNDDESDWGFTNFAELRELHSPSWENKGRGLIENQKVTLTAYVRQYKDPTGVLWHNFLKYDSKKETGMVGLKNQGATCYLNSLLQSLYFTNGFRKAIYNIQTEQNSDKETCTWALQRLFYLLQSSDEAISTQELTRSFGWETRHIFEQQDVQELSRKLMERMEGRMKGTDAEQALAKMFAGKMKTYISCINIDYESSRIEDFWDIQLNVKGNKNLEESFKDYVQVETMDGDNKYFAEGHGLQDARKGVIFVEFPQILHLQLKRFEYDVHRDAMTKINDRYEFPDTFDASPYLSDAADGSESHVYHLHSVLVHSGDFNAGHYYAFLRPTAQGGYYKFDDDRVTRATDKEALEDNFGGDYRRQVSENDSKSSTIKARPVQRSMSAYMLVYVRASRIPSLLCATEETGPPAHIATQLEKERRELEKLWKEREEQHLYKNVQIVTMSQFKAYQGFDLTDWSTDGSISSPKLYRVLKESTIAQLKHQIAADIGLNDDDLRLWVMVNRQNDTLRPEQPLTIPSMTVESASQKHSSSLAILRLWVEEVGPSTKQIQPCSQQSPTDADQPILILLKYFDFTAQTLKGVGHTYLFKQSKVHEFVGVINQIMGWNSNGTNSSNLSLETREPNTTSIKLYEEIKSSMIDVMKLDFTLHQAELQNGDIVCFQHSINDVESRALSETGKFSDAVAFYEYLLNRKRVKFYKWESVPKETPDFELDLSRKMTYEQLSKKVGEKLKVDPNYIRFCTVNQSTGKPKSIVRSTARQNVHQILNPVTGHSGNGRQRDDALIYEELEVSLNELYHRKPLKVNFVSEKHCKEEQIDILAPKIGTVADILPLILKKIDISAEEAPFLRLFEVSQNRIYRHWMPEEPLSTISDYSIILADVAPPDERDIEGKDNFIRCFHFDKDPTRSHGVPFTLKTIPGERFEQTRNRIAHRVGLNDKQVEKIKFALLNKLYAKPVYISDSDIVHDIKEVDGVMGLDHLSKSKANTSKSDSIFIR